MVQAVIKSKKGIPLYASDKFLYASEKLSMLTMYGAYGIENAFKKEPKQMRWYKYPGYSHLCEIILIEKAIWLSMYALFSSQEEVLGVITNNLDHIYEFLSRNKMEGVPMLYDCNRNDFVSGNDFEVREKLDLSEIPSYHLFMVEKTEGYITEPNKVIVFDNKTNRRLHTDACVVSFFNHLPVFTAPQNKMTLATGTISMLSVIAGLFNGISIEDITEDLNVRDGDSLSYLVYRIRDINFEKNERAKLMSQKFDAEKLKALLGKASDDEMKSFVTPDVKKENQHFISKIIDLGLPTYIRQHVPDKNKIEIEIDMNATGIEKMFIIDGAAFVKPSSMKVKVDEFQEMLGSSEVYIIMA